MDAREPLDVIVTNFNRNFTGVSATAAAVIARQNRDHNLNLVGFPLPGCPEPVKLTNAMTITRKNGSSRPVIWHVRRNIEMTTAIFARDIMRLPIKTVFTSSARRLHSAFPRWLISRMDAVIATTDHAASFVPNVFAVAPHGVDTDKFQPAENRLECWAKSGIPGTMGIATVGRVRPEKGTDIFVETMIRTLPRLPGAKALIIGKATSEHRAFEEDLKRRISDAGQSERIIFTGELSSDRLAGILPGLSLLVATPRYEGYGMTALEAMASGVPVVASNTGHFAKFLEGGECGSIVENNDPASISDLALQFLTNPDRLEAAGAAARNRAVGQFSIEREVEAIDKVYHALLAGKAPSEVANLVVQ